jgi:amino acid transporter/nucleotide-binding universal stress UspA family protein
MAEPKTQNNQDFEVSFSRSLGLFDASMIGIGAMIGAGIFVLTGIAAGEAGPGAILAFALNGAVTLLTALTYAELASAFPETGGGYSFIKKAFPGPVGFASGWMLWFSYIVACALYALGFGAYFWEFVHSYFPYVTDAVFGVFGHHVAVVLMTALVCVGFVFLNAKGTAVTGKVENVITIAKIAILIVFILFGLKVIVGAPTESFRAFTPFLPKGFTGVVLAMGLTFIAFEGYDLIATVAEEIKAPEKNIPRATMISLTVAISIYLLILFVCIGAIRPEDGSASWEFLGKYQETAIVKAAAAFMPAFGIALIIFGGLLSTTSALNATILASSRVAFSMGRDKMLPRSMAKIHPVKRTPHVAVFVTGVIVLIMSVAFPIQVVGSAASLMFLLTFALVNFSLIALRRKHPEVKSAFRVPVYPHVPILAILLNLYLALYQYQFDPRSWFITIGWIVAGLFIYFLFFEKATEEERPQVLDISQAAIDSGYEYRILVPLHNPDHVQPLLDLAAPIAKERGGELIVLGVVDVPRNLPIHEGMRFVHHKTPLLREAVSYGQKIGVPVRTSVRIAHRVSDGILAAAEQQKATLILMGWKGWTSKRDRIFGEVTDQVVRHAPCDLITVKLTGSLELNSVLMPTAGGPHATLAAEYIGAMQKTYDTKVAVCNIVPETASDRDREVALNWIDKTIARTGLEGVAEKRVIESNHIAGGLVKAGSDYDMIVLGASREGIFSSVLLGEITEKVARHSRKPVMIVKRYEGVVKSLVRKVIG